MRHAVLLLAVLTAFSAGCGESGERSSGDREPKATPLSADQRAAGDVALKYLRAVRDKDWDAVCATRTAQERREMARFAGSCPKAMRAVFEGKPTSLFEGLRVTDVRIRGDLAGVDLVHPGQSKPALTLAARREAGRWLLDDVPDKKVP
jgi:hypothetical protein